MYILYSLVLSPKSTRRPPITPSLTYSNVSIPLDQILLRPAPHPAAKSRLTLLVIFKLFPSAICVPFNAFSKRLNDFESKASALVTMTSNSPRYAAIREEKSAKTLGADESLPFSDRTVRRLVRIGEDEEGRNFLRLASRSEEDRVGFSIGGVS